MASETPAPFTTAADALAQSCDADVLLINAGINRASAAQVAELCERRRRRKNVVLVLVTSGGDAHAAYLIARCLLDSYSRYTLFVTGLCKSAGTLVAIGAHELVVGRRGELGPLDVQMSKPDELLQRQSGLTATTALAALHEHAFDAFEHFFLSLVQKSGSAITTRTATHVAVQLTSGLFSQIYEHIDPMHVGEAGLALQIAQHYGQLLMAKSGNLSGEALEYLATGFPAHEFVIDFAQIRLLFKRVRQPNETEQDLARLLSSAALMPMRSGERPIVAYISTEQAVDKEHVSPLSDSTGEQHGQATADMQPATSRDAVDGGEAAAGEPGAASDSHVTAIGSGRIAGTGRRR